MISIKHGIILVALATLTSGLAGQTPATKLAVVNYVSGDAVYIGAGRADGLREDTEVDLIRGGAVAATLKVAYLSTRQASCLVVTGRKDIAVGDTVRFAPVAEIPAAGAAAVASSDSARPAPKAAVMSAARPWQPPPIRGQISAQYLAVNGRDSLTSDLTQPAIYVRLDGHNLGGSPVGLLLDARTRMTTTQPVGGGLSSQDNVTRVYLAALLYNAPGSSFHLTVGRQYSPVISSVSYFDGLLAEVVKPAWSVGLLGGVQPDPATLQFSTDVQEGGLYFQLHNRPASTNNWSFTVGGIGSYTQGQPNREFAFLQGTYNSRALSLFAVQELDFYRGQKADLGEPAVSPTNSLVNLSVRVSDAVTLSAGLDDRRNVRLYRDLVTPLTQFDDAFRTGAWGGMSVLVARRLRFGADIHSTLRDPTTQGNIYSGYFSTDRFSPLHLNIRARTSRYDNNQMAGWLHSGTLGVSPTSWVQVEANVGTRNDERSTSSLGLNHLTWYGGSVDLSLARAWFLNFSLTREDGSIGKNDQAYGMITFRF
jgi:hypothetical protein